MYDWATIFRSFPTTISLLKTSVLSRVFFRISRRMSFLKVSKNGGNTGSAFTYPLPYFFLANELKFRLVEFASVPDRLHVYKVCFFNENRVFSLFSFIKPIKVKIQKKTKEGRNLRFHISKLPHHAAGGRGERGRKPIFFLVSFLMDCSVLREPGPNSPPLSPQIDSSRLVFVGGNRGLFVAPLKSIVFRTDEKGVVFSFFFPVPKRREKGTIVLIFS